MGKTVTIGNVNIGTGTPLFLIAGPCVIEDAALALNIAAALREITAKLGIPFVFKASYDKANRTSLTAFRGPGIAKGLEILGRIRDELGIPVLSDVHSAAEIHRAAAVLDVLQIPAFLCRQTDFILQAAKAGKPVNIKKGQFLAPWDMANVAEKFVSTGNRELLITERGTMFGYNNLVVDFRGIRVLKALGHPVVFDATHSIQLPGGRGASSGGQREYAPVLARAAVAAGVDGVFMEVHPDPDKALCDGPNSIRLDAVAPLLAQLKRIREALSDAEESGG